ncbi:MAG: hypothetical protein FJ006_12695 [Chloroflexi bacterium]|nr:hypothetical protein [Chloroflexota bacterium]
MKWEKDNCTVGCIYKTHGNIGGVKVKLLIDHEDKYVAYVYIGGFKKVRSYSHLRSAKRGCIRMIRQYITEAVKIFEVLNEHLNSNA